MIIFSSTISEVIDVTQSPFPWHQPIAIIALVAFVVFLFLAPSFLMKKLKTEEKLPKGEVSQQLLDDAWKQDIQYNNALDARREKALIALSAVVIAIIVYIPLSQRINAALEEEHRNLQTADSTITSEIKEKYDIQSIKLHFETDDYHTYKRWIKSATKDNLTSTYHNQNRAISTVHLKNDEVYDYTIFITPSYDVVLEPINSTENSAPSPSSLLKK